MTEGLRCSSAARARHEPMAGTAPVCRRLLLVEHSGPWARLPLRSAPLVSHYDELRSAVEGRGGQVFLIRRPGREGRTLAERRWWVVDTATGTAVVGRWEDPRDLLAAAAHLEGLPADAGVAPRMVLVCTHATRDVCCAVRGRPIVAGLATAMPDVVWECSHLGGHRFAGTLAILPAGVVLGGLEPATALAEVRRHFLGRIGAEHYRGHVRLARPAQFAVAAALAERGGCALGDVGEVTMTPVAPGPDTTAQAPDATEAWDVTLDGGLASRWRVTSTPGEPVLQSCAATETSAAPVFRAEPLSP